MIPNLQFSRPQALLGQSLTLTQPANGE